jgi:hypothetical protein
VVVQSTSSTLVLERRPVGSERTTWPTESVVPGWEIVDETESEEPAAATGGLGFMLRAPGLVILATAFLIEGYRWLGVLHFGASAAGSWLFGTVGLALVALVAPLAALLLTCGRQGSGRVATEDLVVVMAGAAALATATALIVGGAAWGNVAGAGDLILAATALGAVILSERARRRAMNPGTGQSSPVS